MAYTGDLAIFCPRGLGTQQGSSVAFHILHLAARGEVELCPHLTAQGAKVTFCHFALFPRDFRGQVATMSSLDAARACQGWISICPFPSKNLLPGDSRGPQLGLAGSGVLQCWRKGVVSFLRPSVLIGGPASPAELVSWAPQPRQESVRTLSGKLRETRSKNCYSGFIGNGKKKRPRSDGS